LPRSSARCAACSPGISSASPPNHNDRVHDGEIKDRTRTVLEWTAALEPGRHRTMVARFFWHQPRFLYDMIRYKLRPRA
jgi:hypothetical protein